MCSGRVGSSCSTSDTRRVNLVKYVYIIPMSMSLLIPGIVFSANKNKSRNYDKININLGQLSNL